MTCADCGGYDAANATVLVGKYGQRPVCDDCMAKAADWRPEVILE